jgi:hypothetical protein
MGLSVLSPHIQLFLIHATPPVYINLPIGITALAVVWFFLRRVHLVRMLPDGSEDTRPRTEVLKHTFRTFDYIGL